MKRIAIILAAIAVLVGCTKNMGLSLNTTEVTMYSLEEHVITTDGTNVKFSSKNPYVANVNETTGKITAMHIGKTTIDVTSDQGTNSVSVTVKPKYNVFKDPEIEWHISQYAVECRCGRPDEQDDETMMYEFGSARNGDKHIGTIYTFDDDVLLSVLVIINNSYWSEAALHLAERFQYIGEEDNTYVYIDTLTYSKAKTTVIMKKVSGQWVILYTPYR